MGGQKTASVLPTVREVLRMEALAEGLPEVVAGREGLGAPVRWVHVAETVAAARLVSGGELLLATGVGWPSDDVSLRRLGRQLADDGVSGLVLELGDPMRQAPPALVAELEAAGVPFVVLHREIRFVAVTEAVHSRIIADQMTALRARDELHALFTQLALRGSPAEFIVEQAARVLGAPVVLEDTGHRVITADGLSDEEAELGGWEQRSRAAHRAEPSPARSAPGAADGDWTIVPVEARGRRWGYLVALPGRPHPAGRSTVLEQAAVALALGRLAEPDDVWVRSSQEALLAALLGRRFASEGGLAARFEAAGFPVTGRAVVGVAVRLRPALPPEPIGDVARRLADAARSWGADALAGVHPALPSTVVVALAARPGRPFSDALFGALAAAAGPGVRSSGARGEERRDAPPVVSAGSESRGIPGLLASLEEAAELSALADPRRAMGASRVVQRVEHRPLLRLVTAFGGDPRMLEHTEQLLGPLIEYDLATGGDLLEVLRAYLTHPGNRTRAAAASHLSRSVFYQRIALIEELLGMDLDDGETVGALHAALLARGASG
ncbi:PucR family transcriptional regulator [Leifsonia sp. AG29]|uniref:PucR family transcriptional regulator n=1 Tax=Leifsonia sp. AG29 TaxID=2598860 RepID=UPI00131DDBEF|nr:PucR family transcriptional regulator [Leifsonia sp. AG29]